MAVAPDIIFAVGASQETNTVTLSNTNPRFPQRKVILNSTSPIVTIDSTKLEWSNYFKAGLLGALTLLSPSEKIPSLNVFIDGNLPTGSGLSSSAAFVVSSATLILYSMGHKKISKSQLTTTAIVSERNVGVNSGGMDQSASVYGLKNYALYIDFVPKLNVHPLAFPGEKVVFVIANTLVNSDKQVTGPRNYNLRVVETTVSAEILARKWELGELKSRDGFGGTLREVVEKMAERNGWSFDEALKNTNEEVAKLWGERGEFTRGEIAEMMGLSEEELVKKYMTRFPGITPSEC